MVVLVHNYTGISKRLLHEKSSWWIYDWDGNDNDGLPLSWMCNKDDSNVELVRKLVVAKASKKEMTREWIVVRERQEEMGEEFQSWSIWWWVKGLVEAEDMLHGKVLMATSRTETYCSLTPLCSTPTKQGGMKDGLIKV
jgi:hypothetical protein